MTARRALLLPFVAGLALTCSALGHPTRQPQPGEIGSHTPVIFVSGMTGTRLADPTTGRIVWGGARPLLAPRDGGRQLMLPIGADTDAAVAATHPQTAYEPVGPIWKIRLLGLTKPVYQPLRERFEAAGYRLGDLTAPNPGEDLFFFDYDWRHGNLVSVRRLHGLLSHLSESRGGVEVDLVCQSNAAKICRWLAKYGDLGLDDAEAGVPWERSYRIRSLVLAGVSNSGALRVLNFLDRGRSYVPLVGRRLLPELFFTLRPLFEDLPADRDDLFFDESGRTLDVDLFDPESWVEYGWSIFGRQATERLERRPASELVGDREEQIAYLARQLSDSRRLQRLLARDSDQFPQVSYYLLENGALPTIDRALLTRRGDEWRLFFTGDRAVDRSPELRRLATARGDGHAVLTSQRSLSPQEAAALVEAVEVEGGHFEAIISPEALDALVRIVARRPEDPSRTHPGLREHEPIANAARDEQAGADYLPRNRVE